jgi:hypothetical protein
MSKLPKSVLGDEEIVVEKEKPDMTPGLIALGVMVVLGAGCLVIFQIYIRKKK